MDPQAKPAPPAAAPVAAPEPAPVCAPKKIRMTQADGQYKDNAILDVGPVFSPTAVTEQYALDLIAAEKAKAVEGPEHDAKPEPKR
jgi:hypothetical protein